MKLLSLNLKAVGPFTDVVLDFSAGQEGLHLIYGPNEAGKTSALRALSHLLFGFPHLSADSFVHPNDRLRVGGKLRRSDGEELEVLRRRGRRSTLRGPDDQSLVPDEYLSRFLGGLSQETFHALFGIDHERLTQAGEEIRTGQGRLGELLFAAGAGLAGLRRAQQMLEQQLDELYKPRAQNPRINKVLAELDETQKELKQYLLPSEQWQEHDRAYNLALGHSDVLQRKIRAARGEQARLKRINSAIPLVAQRARLERDLGELGNAIRLRDEFGIECRAAQDQLRLAEHTIASARNALDEIRAQVAQLDRPRLPLDAADEIESLQTRSGAVDKAAFDRVRLVDFERDSEHQACKILRDLGRPPELEEAVALALRADEPAIIRKLGHDFAQLRGKTDETRRTIARHADQIKHLERELAELEKARDVEPLRHAIQEARQEGDLDAHLAEARARYGRAKKKAEVALAQLPYWSQPAQALECLAVPSSTTLELYESRFQEASRQAQVLAERLASETDSIRQLEAQLHSLEAQQDVPTEEALRDARRRREQGWRLVKEAWLDGKSEGENVEAFLAEFAPGDTLASAYEQSVQRGDALADRLRREADRVARKAEWLARLGQHRSVSTALEHDRRLLEEHRLRMDRDWDALIAPLRLQTGKLAPSELRSWLRQREEALGHLQKAEETRQGLEPLERAFNIHYASTSRALEEVAEHASASDATLGAVLERAEAVVKRQDNLAREQAKLETRLVTARAELANAQLSLQTAEGELARWQTEWSVHMTRIGLEAQATPQQAEVFLNKIDELQEKLDERRSYQSRIRGIDRDADEFARDVAALVARIASDWTGRPANEQARELARRLRDARAAEQKLTALFQQSQREETKLHAAEAQHEEARVCLERLCKEAGCTEFDQLSDAECRSRDRVQLETELALCDEQLIVAAAGTDLAAFVGEVGRADPDALGSMIEELELKIATQEDALRCLDQTIGTERGELDRMDGSDRAAQRAEKAQTLLAQLQGDVPRYAALKLAASVLQRGVERYREKNQGPILVRASALFASLTGRSFARLQIDDDGEGRSVLKGVRPDGQVVEVKGMSDGSHDQLYLALRLASLESWLDSHEPIPFVVDDILLNFDDVRATAALQALAELSHRVQVLFFTHHWHIVELARAHLPGAVIFVHELPGPRFHSQPDEPKPSRPLAMEVGAG